jgi:hypothetical protein
MLVPLCAIGSLARRRVFPALWLGGEGLVLLRSLVGWAALPMPA